MIKCICIGAYNKVVDGKVINRELVWGNAEGGTGILLRISTSGLCLLPSSPAD
jgi:hypothetical protein